MRSLWHGLQHTSTKWPYLLIALGFVSMAALVITISLYHTRTAGTHPNEESAAKAMCKYATSVTAGASIRKMYHWIMSVRVPSAPEIYASMKPILGESPFTHNLARTTHSALSQHYDKPMLLLTLGGQIYTLAWTLTRSPTIVPLDTTSPDSQRSNICG